MGHMKWVVIKSGVLHYSYSSDGERQARCVRCKAPSADNNKDQTLSLSYWTQKAFIAVLRPRNIQTYR